MQCGISKTIGGGTRGLTEFVKRLLEIGYPVAYRSFPEGDVPKAPYIVYYTSDTDNFSADGIVYYRVSNLLIELYCDKKDLVAEQALEKFLNEQGMFYEKDEVYIESEKYLEVIYMTGI